MKKRIAIVFFVVVFVVFVNHAMFILNKDKYDNLLVSLNIVNNSGREIDEINLTIKTIEGESLIYELEDLGILEIIKEEIKMDGSDFDKSLVLDIINNNNSGNFSKYLPVPRGHYYIDVEFVDNSGDLEANIKYKDLLGEDFKVILIQ